MALEVYLSTAGYSSSKMTTAVSLSFSYATSPLTFVLGCMSESVEEWPQWDKKRHDKETQKPVCNSWQRSNNISYLEQQIVEKPTI